MIVLIIKAILIAFAFLMITNYLTDFAVWYIFFGTKVKVGQVYLLDFPGSTVKYEVINVRNGWANLNAHYTQFDGSVIVVPVLKTTRVLRQVYKLKKN